MSGAAGDRRGSGVARSSKNEVPAAGGEQLAWWTGAVLYQVYVRSYLDTDGDGYGDLRGVLERLDHLAWLGVEGIWLSPTFPSPDADWGYDVADYYAVHPELGTLEDLDGLVAAAAQRGIRVLLDLVPNHTSTAHPWFVDARGSRGAEHRDFYVWADPAEGGGPPNNWLAATGEAAWTLDEASGQYYLHNFLPAQADLNWWNPAVHAAFEDIIGFWFDRGIAGFRIDVAHALYKDAELRDNPLMPAGLERWGNGGQQAVYSANRPEVHGVYRDWRRIAEGYEPPALLLGETWVLDLDRLAAFYGDDDELQLAFNFPFVLTEFGAEGLSSAVETTMAALPAGACPVWTGSNHDVSRLASRWGGGDEQRARLALAVLLTLPGTVVLYYGDELAMTDVAVPRSEERDLMHRSARSGRPSRDRARTPMVWDDSPGAGFSPPGVRPWLPVGDRSRNVAAQRDEPGSTLRLCRSLVALRREHLQGRPVSYEGLGVADAVWSYRSGGLVVHANFARQPRNVDPAGLPVLALTAPPAEPPAAPGEGLVLPASSAAVLGPVPE